MLERLPFSASLSSTASSKAASTAAALSSRDAVARRESEVSEREIAMTQQRQQRELFEAESVASVFSAGSR